MFLTLKKARDLEKRIKLRDASVSSVLRVSLLEHEIVSQLDNDSKKFFELLELNNKLLEIRMNIRDLIRIKNAECGINDKIHQLELLNRRSLLISNYTSITKFRDDSLTFDEIATEKDSINEYRSKRTVITAPFITEINVQELKHQQLELDQAKEELVDTLAVLNATTYIELSDEYESILRKEQFIL